MRKTIRLRNFDYSSNGAYFITICTHRRQSLLAGEALKIVEREFEALPSRFSGLVLDSRRFMPDHLHAILQMGNCIGTLSAIVQAFKSLSAREVHRVHASGRLWQRGFYDRIIRNEVELAALREYIEHNDIVHAVRRGVEHL